MLSKSIHEIGLADLQDLKQNGVPEGKTIEYKREMPANTNDEKAKLLAAVSSFANTAGGDLLLGVEESKGLPTSFGGVAVADVDKEKARLEQVIASGLEPRLPRLDIHTIPVQGGKHVIVIRVPKSWTAPHRVKLNSRFYGRNSSGRYELDVGDLRYAFTLSETVAERIRNFRTGRVAKILGGEMPGPLWDSAVIALHGVPLSSFTTAERFDVPALHDAVVKMQTLSGGGNPRTNLDGAVLYNRMPTGRPTFASQPRDGWHAYTQVFREGMVETASVIDRRDGRPSLPSIAYEQRLGNFLERCIRALTSLGVEPPIYVFLSLVGSAGCELGISGEVAVGYSPLDQNVVILPEVVVEDLNSDPYAVLRPAFDMVWNAFGLERSANFDGDGNWRHKR